jgi:N-methylhydantoinase A
VLAPYQPGTTSALGLLVSDPKHTHLLSKIEWFDEVHPEEMESIFNELEVKGKGQMVSEGFERDKIVVHRSLGLRYIGQGYEVSVPVGKSITNKEDKHHLRVLFDDLHESLYGHRAPGQPLEVCYYQVDTVVPVRLPKLAEARSSGRSAEECVKVHREVYFPEEAHFVDTPIYDREQLSPGMMIAGPAIVEEEFSTTVVYPGQSARVDRYKNILINVKGRN